MMKELNLEKSIKEVFATLKDKEKEILVNRFGLFSEKAKTLALIGKNLGLTRERIRQIQNSALNKIKNSPLSKEKIFVSVQRIASIQGGLVHVKNIEDKLNTSENYASFLLEASAELKRIKGYKNLANTFIDKKIEQKDIIGAEKEIIAFLKKKQKAMEVEKIIKTFQTQKKYQIEASTLKSLIYASKSFAFDWKKRCGLSIWREVNPKSARDKAYYILKKEQRPLHFTHIADLIAKNDFVGKNPTAATVHNELILDQRFVLVGRGIYALSEWGFRGGTVEEVIAEILQTNPKGMKRDDIIEEVLKTKLVARNTVMMNLLVKKQFVRDKEGNYKLAKL